MLVLLGQMLEAKARNRTGNAIKALMGQAAKTARVVRDGTESEVPVGNVGKAVERKIALENPEGFQSVTGGGVTGRVNGSEVAIGNPRFLLDRGLGDFESQQVQATQLQKDGHTVIFVGLNGRLGGSLAVADPIKKTTPEAIAELHRLGIRVQMLTGDNCQTAKAVANQLKIDVVHAEVAPGDKHRVVQDLRTEGQTVAMAGDGINDAPALAAANVGIAKGTGTDVAIESAGVNLVKGDSRGVVKAIHLSRQVMRNIRQNLFFSFIYNAIGVPVAAGLLYPFFGILLSPIIASAAMSLSSVSVVANAQRLARCGSEADLLSLAPSVCPTGANAWGRL